MINDDTITVDEAYSYYQEHCNIPDNYDLHITIFEYIPVKDIDFRFKEIFRGYFPYPKVFPFKNAHMFGKFVLETTGDIKDEDGDIFKAEHGKYYTFILIYTYYRTKKKPRVRWKRIDVFNE